MRDHKLVLSAHFDGISVEEQIRLFAQVGFEGFLRLVLSVLVFLHDLVVECLNLVTLLLLGGLKIGVKLGLQLVVLLCYHILHIQLALIDVSHTKWLLGNILGHYRERNHSYCQQNEFFH